YCDHTRRSDGGFYAAVARSVLTGRLALQIGTIENLDQGQKSEWAGCYKSNRRDVLTNVVTLLRPTTAGLLVPTSCSQQRRATRLRIERLPLQRQRTVPA